MSKKLTFQLVLVSLIVVLPVFLALVSWWPLSLDLFCYSTLLKLFSSQFWSGELYPRWLINANAGLGSPAFLFYAPVPFYMGSLFEWLVGYDANGFVRALLTMFTAIFISGTTAYYWLKSTMPREKAELGALAYASFQYISVITNVSFGLPQICAFAILPLLLKFAHDMARGSWRAIPLLSVGYALLALTHLPTTIVFCLIPLSYVAFFAETGKKISHTFFACFAALLGGMLSAFYMLPMTMNKGNIGIDEFTTGKFYYRDNIYDPMSYLYMAIIAVPMLVMIILRNKSDKIAEKSELYFWISILLLVVFMTTAPSLLIWDNLPFLQQLQFPSRFLIAAIPAVVYICAKWLVTRRNKIIYFSSVAIISLGIIISAIESGYTTQNSEKNTLILQSNSLACGALETKWMAASGLRTISGTPITKDFIETPEYKFLEGTGKLQIQYMKDREIKLNADITSENSLVALRRFYFPGWEITGKGKIFENNALIALELPRGRQDITLKLPWFYGEKEGIIISLSTLVVLLSIVVAARKCEPQTA